MLLFSWHGGVERFVAVVVHCAFDGLFLDELTYALHGGDDGFSVDLRMITLQRS